MSVLSRKPGERFSRVERLWAGETAVLVGGGPSLSEEQVERVRAAHEAGRVRVVAVNDAYLRLPCADVCYFADSHWWKWHYEGIEKPGLSAGEVRERFATFAGQKCSIQNSGANIHDELVHILRNKHFPMNGNGLSLDPAALVTGRHGGFQALNLAVLAGAKRALLLGYDGRRGANGTHWFGQHPRPTPEAAFAEYRRAFSAAERDLQRAGVEVINCTPGSAIDSFPKVSLNEVL